jgi:UDP-glucose 4-epimerase
MKALVTGGAGFIGSNLVNRLLKDGHQVTVVDNESSDAHDHPYWNEDADNYNLDIFDYEKLKFLMKDADVVFHLAAEARIQPAIENPRLAVQTNVLGTCNVLQAARENNVKRVVYSSTSSAYGLVNPIPNTEDMPKDCLNPYSVSKTAGEELCTMYSDLFGLETVIFRYFNVYGENQPTKGQYAPVIGLFQRQHKAGEPMTVVGDGLQRRDYVNVDDVVEVNLLAATSELNKMFQVSEFAHMKVGYGEIFNIGTGTNHSVMDLVELIGGKDAEYKYIEQRPGEARETLSDSTKAKRVLNWKPQVKLEDWILNNE